MPNVDCRVAIPDRSPGFPSPEENVYPVSRGRARGFTLIELLVVIAMIALIVAVVSPSIGSGLSLVKLRTSGREIAAALRLARTKAVKEQQIYYIGFDSEKGEVELASADANFQKTFRLPDGISFKEILTGDDQQTEEEETYCFFLPNGMAQNCSVKIGNERGRELVVVHDSYLRSPRIEEPEPEPLDRVSSNDR